MLHREGNCWGSMLSLYVKVRARKTGSRWAPDYDRHAKGRQTWVRVGSWCERCGTVVTIADATVRDEIARAREPAPAS